MEVVYNNINQLSISNIVMYLESSRRNLSTAVVYFHDNFKSTMVCKVIVTPAKKNITTDEWSIFTSLSLCNHVHFISGLRDVVRKSAEKSIQNITKLYLEN